MKKIISFFLVGVFLLVTPITAFAKDTNTNMPSENKGEVVRIGERSLIETLKKKSDEELKKDGMTDIQIKELRELDYSKELLKRAKLDESQLANMGYKKEQIQQLKKLEINKLVSQSTKQTDNIQFSSVELASTEAKCYIYSSLYDSFNYSHDKVIKFSWGWTSTPICNYTDLIGLGWQASNNGYYVVSSFVSSGSYCFINYSNNAPNSQPSVVPLGSGHAQISIPMTKFVNNAPYPSYAISGYGNLQIHSDAVINGVEFRAGYGHSIVNITPGLDISTGGVSFSFNPQGKVEEDDYSYHYFTY